MVIQLSGGNDGLNTWVPFSNDLYFNKRPSLALPTSEILRLNDDMGLHPKMEGIRALYDEGYVLALNQVGYPNAERSHFRAMDIWHSASNSDEYWQSGWLGRYLDATCEAGSPAHVVTEVDDTLSLAVKGERYKALAMKNARRMNKQVRSPHIQQFMGQGAPGNDQLDYLYKTLQQTVESVEYLYEHTRIQRSKADYPQTPFGKKLKQVAELMAAGVDTQVYYLSLSGFDTHVRQGAQQARLLEQYSQAISVFVKDLQEQQIFDDAMIFTFSEFGRRVEENASGGTDHGKANACWLIGKKLKQQGYYGGNPDLASLDAGDLGFQIDFRQVYSSIIQNWLGGDSAQVLKRAIEPLSII